MGYELKRLPPMHMNNRKRIHTADHAVGCTCSPALRAPASANGGGNSAGCVLHRRTKTADAIAASGVFTNEKIGPKRSLTPEGFLLCEGVPIARTGTQDYAYFELPGLEAKDGVIVAERGADVLFSAETIASFEGKPITIGHPPDFVSPSNWRVVAVGVVFNVRRGEGAQSELMLADLLIMDAEAIRRVQEDGPEALDEVSNGYDADYEQIAPGRARQVTIVGNHVALVKNARCGPVCSIGDSNDAFETGVTTMTTKTKALLDKLRKAFMTRDSDTFEATAKEMTGDEGEGEGGNGLPAIHIHIPGGAAGAAEGTGPTKDNGGAAAGAGEGDDPMAQVLGAITELSNVVKGIGERVAKLEAGGTPTGDADPDGDGDGDPTLDSDPDGEGKPTMTGDSATLRDEFQDAMSRAEILAPGVKLPTFDAKAEKKRTADSICVLRRRALRASLDGEHADLVKSVTGGADVSKLTCDAAKFVFNSASELVRQHNKLSMQARTGDGANPTAAKPVDINAVHKEFWKGKK